MRLNKKASLPGGDNGYLRPVDGRDVKGVYSNFPAYTPKYLSTNGRDYVRELTVARLYLSGGAYETLPGVAPWFSVNSYVGFFLQEVTERNSEKSQIIPMNGDGYAAFFSGREPRVYSFSGVVLNTQQDQWRSTLANLYEEVFRGSKVAGMNRVVQIAYDDKVVSGSMMNMTQVVSSAPDETFAKFAFDILVVAVYDAWMTSDDDFVATGSAFLGDKTIFPDMTRSEPKKNLRDYGKSQYIAPPPNVKPQGAGTKCDLSKITVDAEGVRIKSQMSSYGSKLPKECLAAGTTAAINAEMDALKKKYEFDKYGFDKFPSDAKGTYDRLNRTAEVIASEAWVQKNASDFEAKKEEAIAIKSIAINDLRKRGYSEETATAIFTPKTYAEKKAAADYLRSHDYSPSQINDIINPPSSPVGNPYVPVGPAAPAAPAAPYVTHAGNAGSPSQHAMVYPRPGTQQTLPD